MEKRIYLYAFNELHRVVDCKYLCEGRISIRSMNYLAEYMLNGKPDIKRIYVVDNRFGLREDFLDTVVHPHFTKDVEFEDMISREGICAWKR